MGAAAGPDIIEDGLVLCLDAANRQSYAGSGTAWRDLAESNNGTLTNGPTFNSANGGSIVFDGSNDFVTIPNGNYLNTNSFTVSLWMYLNNIITAFTTYCFLNKNVYNTSGISASLGTAGSTGSRRLAIRCSTTENAALVFNFDPSASLVTFDAWHNVVLIFKYNVPNSQILTYIDGIYSQTSTPVSGTFVSNANALRVGSSAPGNGVYHKGKISSYQIYNRALTPAEITQNYNATKGRFRLT